MDYQAILAAMFTFVALVCAVLACGLPLWATTRSFPTTSIGDREARLEIGIWKVCLTSPPEGAYSVRDCWSLRNDYVGEAFVAAEVLYILGLAIAAVAVLMLVVISCTAIARDGPVHARVCIFLCALSIACYASAFGCAVGGLNADRGNAEEFMDIQNIHYGPSFYLGIAALVISVIAMPFVIRTAFLRTVTV